MKAAVTRIQIGSTPRLETLLPVALEGLSVRWMTSSQLHEENVVGQHLLFTVGMDAFGPNEEFYGLLRWLRQHVDAPHWAAWPGLVVDGGGELYTKQAAQTLVMAANLAGCAFLGKPLVEGTAPYITNTFWRPSWG